MTNQIAPVNWKESIADFQSEAEFFRAVIQSFVDICPQINHPMHFEGGAKAFAIMAADNHINPEKDIIRPRPFESIDQLDRFEAFAIDHFCDEAM